MTPVSPLGLLLLLLGLSCLGMAFTFFVALKISNFGIVDVAWSASFGIFALLLALLSRGAPERKALAGLMLGLWSMRLTSYLGPRVARSHPEEDSRYVALRQEWRSQLKLRFFIFFQAQSLSVLILLAPFAWIMSDTRSGIRPLEWTSLALWIVALLGESIADRQMSRFRKDPTHRGMVCEWGLWRYSRHPNYFFESLIWWAFFLLALSQPHGWLAIYLPLSMLGLLLFVTGVPMAEAQSLKSRGEAYRQYQARTSVFIPWFPKGPAKPQK